MTAMETILARDLAATAFASSRAECPAQTIGYTPEGGTETEILALRESGHTEIRDEGGGEQQYGEEVWLVRRSDVTAPTAQDRIAYSGKTYQVRGWSAASVLWRITAARVESLQKRTPGAREGRE